MSVCLSPPSRASHMFFCSRVIKAVYWTLILLSNLKLWPDGSQVLSFPDMPSHITSMEQGRDPGVGFSTTTNPGAFTVKFSGKGGNTAAPWNNSRKRAFRRARRRAEQAGGTVYRGRWRSAAELGTARTVPETSSTHGRVTTQQPRQYARLRAMTYNVGGFCPTSYDVFCCWLNKQRDLDIIFVQELHWGCGSTDNRWRIGSWTALVSPDPGSRYASVGIFVHERVASDDSIGYNPIIPGRLLHVRCEGPRTDVDLLVGYQWIWQARNKDDIQRRRCQFWTKFGSLLHTLPARNLLLFGMDLNSRIRSLPGLIGRGILAGSQGPDTELEAVLEPTWCC